MPSKSGAYGKDFPVRVNVNMRYEFSNGGSRRDRGKRVFLSVYRLDHLGGCAAGSV